MPIRVVLIQALGSESTVVHGVADTASDTNNASVADGNVYTTAD